MPNGDAARGWASPERPKWTYLEIGIGLGVLLAGRSLGLLHSDWLTAVPYWLRIVLGMTFPLFLLAYPFVLAKRRGFAAAFVWPTPTKAALEAAISLLILMGVLLLFGCAGQVIKHFWPQTPLTPEIWQRAAETGHTGRLILILIYAFTLAPIAEEVFFRGFLHNALRSRLPLVIAALVQSLIFAALHEYGPLHLVLVFILGLIFTAVYEWRKSLLTSMFLHAGVNFFGALGIFVLMISNANGPSLGVHGEDRPEGCLVIKVSPDSAAEKAGLAPGDVITDLDSQPIGGIQQLRAAVRRHRAGDTVTVAVTRSGARLELRAVLQKRSQEKPPP